MQANAESDDLSSSESELSDSDADSSDSESSSDSSSSDSSSSDAEAAKTTPAKRSKGTKSPAKETPVRGQGMNKVNEERRKRNFDQVEPESSGPKASGWGSITGSGGKKRFSRVNIEAATASISHPEMHDNSS